MNIVLWKQLKKELKLKYEDIAKLSGIPLTTVKNIFCGYVKTPRIDTVQAIEKALGITDGEQYSNNSFNINLTGDETDVLFKYREVEKVMGEKGKSLVIDFCNSLIDAFKKNPL